MKQKKKVQCSNTSFVSLVLCRILLTFIVYSEHDLIQIFRGSVLPHYTVRIFQQFHSIICFLVLNFPGLAAETLSLRFGQAFDKTVENYHDITMNIDLSLVMTKQSRIIIRIQDFCTLELWVCLVFFNFTALSHCTAKPVFFCPDCLYVVTTFLRQSSWQFCCSLALFH